LEFRIFVQIAIDLLNGRIYRRQDVLNWLERHLVIPETC
jgi:hypothetical protein